MSHTQSSNMQLALTGLKLAPSISSFRLIRTVPSNTFPYLHVYHIEITPVPLPLTQSSSLYSNVPSLVQRPPYVVHRTFQQLFDFDEALRKLLKLEMPHFVSPLARLVDRDLAIKPDSDNYQSREATIQAYLQNICYLPSWTLNSELIRGFFGTWPHDMARALEKDEKRDDHLGELVKGSLLEKDLLPKRRESQDLRTKRSVNSVKSENWSGGEGLIITNNPQIPLEAVQFDAGKLFVDPKVTSALAKPKKQPSDTTAPTESVTSLPEVSERINNPFNCTPISSSTTSSSATGHKTLDKIKQLINKPISPYSTKSQVSSTTNRPDTSGSTLTAISSNQGEEVVLPFGSSKESVNDLPRVEEVAYNSFSVWQPVSFDPHQKRVKTHKKASVSTTDKDGLENLISKNFAHLFLGNAIKEPSVSSNGDSSRSVIVPPAKPAKAPERQSQQRNLVSKKQPPKLSLIDTGLRENDVRNKTTDTLPLCPTMLSPLISSKMEGTLASAFGDGRDETNYLMLSPKSACSVEYLLPDKDQNGYSFVSDLRRVESLDLRPECMTQGGFKREKNLDFIRRRNCATSPSVASSQDNSFCYTTSPRATTSSSATSPKSPSLSSYIINSPTNAFRKARNSIRKVKSTIFPTQQPGGGNKINAASASHIIPRQARTVPLIGTQNPRRRASMPNGVCLKAALKATSTVGGPNRGGFSPKQSVSTVNVTDPLWSTLAEVSTSSSSYTDSQDVEGADWMLVRIIVNRCRFMFRIPLSKLKLDLLENMVQRKWERTGGKVEELKGRMFVVKGSEDYGLWRMKNDDQLMQYAEKVIQANSQLLEGSDERAHCLVLYLV